MNTTTSATRTTTRTLSPRTVRLAKEFIRLNTKFSKQNMADRALNSKEVADLARKAVVLNESRDFPNLEAIKTEDVANAVLEMMAFERGQRLAKIEDERKARLVECPACGIKRRDPRFEHCAFCARLDAENETLIKAGKLRPNAPLSLEEIDAIAECQQRAACEELYRLYAIDQLPKGCEVVMETEKELRIQTPITLFILHIAEAASVHELSIDLIDEEWDTDTVAA